MFKAGIKLTIQFLRQLHIIEINGYNVKESDRKLRRRLNIEQLS